MFLLCLCWLCPEEPPPSAAAPAPCSQCSVMTTGQSLQAFAGGASSQEPMLRGAVTQPGPSSPFSSLHRDSRLLPAAGPRATSWASSPPARQDGPLQLGAANSALWGFSKKQMPREGGKGRAAGTGGWGQAGPVHGAPSVRPPRVEFCLVSTGAWWWALGLPRPLSSDHDRIQGEAVSRAPASLFMTWQVLT